MKQTAKLISIVIPAFNESKIISTSVSRVIKTLIKIIKISLINNYEIIFVDDGSKDNTWGCIKNLHKKNSRIKGIKLSRNFGMQTALMAGLKKATGDYTVILECDLQDPPELIEGMLNKLIKTRSDIVCGKRISRSESGQKQFVFKLFHYIFHNISNIKVPQNVGTFSILNRRALTALLSFKEKNRYIPALRYLVGYKQIYVNYERLDRVDGPAKMSTSKLLALASDALFSFTDFPLKFCLFLGFTGVLLSLLVGLYAIISRLFNFNVIIGWSSTLLSIYFFGSLQLIFLGVIGQYIFKIYIEVQDRPDYFISDETK